MEIDVSDGLVLYGIALLDGGEPSTLAADTTVVPVRDLGAVTAPAPYQRQNPDERDLERHAAVLSTVAERNAVAPAPVGTVFRDRAALVRWMELHYHALHESLAYLDGRLVARVHIVKRDPESTVEGAALAARAADVLKNLRAQAAAMVPLKTEQLTGIVLSGAFLVEREKWGTFTSAVGAAAAAHTDLDIRMTGPWPPYDFVRLDLGG
jgi:Gas vesicle synthesis protein GvpL/GvpF